MPRINVLDKQTAELIAAGEVVERPASVVKELVENAIDAGATVVTVEIQSGGVRYIRVTDNGCGMEPGDVPTAFLRHATSKVASAADLFSICTLGFRGEALPSIGAVARVSLLTRTRDSALGASYAFEGGEKGELTEAGCPVGTTIVVRDLFYNVPARMKFLKKDSTEGAAVGQLIDRLALSHPEVSFKFLSDGQQKLFTPGDGNLLSDLYAVCGGDFTGGLVEVSLSRVDIEVSGYITKPECCRATRGMQSFFINHRYVRCGTMMAALEQAYRNRVMTGRFPGCALCVAIPAGAVDVNVHPAKLEVKLTDEKTVYDAVYAACSAALSGLDNRVKASDTAAGRNRISYFELTNRPTAGTQQRMTAQEYRALSAAQAKNPAPREVRELPVKQPPEPAAVVSRPTAPLRSASAREAYLAALQRPVEPARSAAPAAPPTPVSAPAPRAPEPPREDAEETVYLGQVFDTYILAQRGDEFLMVDKHAAHERVVYNELKAGFAAGEIPRQLLLSSERITLPRQQYQAAADNLDILARAGFLCEDFGGSDLLLREIPAVMDLASARDAVEEIASQLSARREFSGADADALYDDLLHSIACKTAIKGGAFTDEKELRELLRAVSEDPEVRTCPHGRPVMLAFSRREIEKMFGRIV